MGRAHEVRAASMAKTAAARSKLYAKFGKEIYIAAKSGVPDPELNQSLKRAIEKAKKEQVSADVIKRAIEKAKGGVGEDYKPVRYEGMGPGNSAIIVECLTDNVNRTYTEVGTVFKKTGALMTNVSFQFKHQAVITVEDTSEDEVLEILIGNDLDGEIEMEDDACTIYADVSLLHSIQDAILATKPNADISTSEIMWIPTMTINLDDESKQKFERLLALLNEIDDVQDVFHNVGNIEILDEE